MAPTGWFIFLAVVTILLLLTASITATIGAAYAFSSDLYLEVENVRNAYQWLTIAAAIGFSSFGLLFVLLLVAAFAGGFTVKELSTAIYSKESPTFEDLKAAHRDEKELSDGMLTQVIVFGILAVLVLLCLIVGLFCIFGAVQLGSMTVRDGNTNFAYTMSIVGSVAGFAGSLLMVFVILTYMAIRNARKNQLKTVEEYEAKTQAQLGVKDVSYLP
jgi:TRAP-type C4-dicarboxylate transport system permease small subunit